MIVHVGAQVLEVLDHEDEFPAQSIGRIQYGGSGSRFGQLLATHASCEGGVSVAEFATDRGVAYRALPRQIEKALQPEVRHVEDLVAVLHEANGQQMPGETSLGAQLGGNTGQEHGLPAAARGDEEHVLTGGCVNIRLQDFEHSGQFSCPHHELPDHLFVGLERSGIGFANRVF